MITLIHNRFIKLEQIVSSFEQNDKINNRISEKWLRRNMVRLWLPTNICATGQNV
jgi:hypothetical protein